MQVQRVKVIWPCSLEAVMEALQFLDIRVLVTRSSSIDLDPLMRRLDNRTICDMTEGEIGGYVNGKPRTLKQLQKYFGGREVTVKLKAPRYEAGLSIKDIHYGTSITDCRFGDGDILVIKAEKDGLEVARIVDCDGSEDRYTDLLVVAAPD